MGYLALSLGRLVRAVAIVAIVAIVAAVAISAETFTGTTDNTWNNATNWDTGAVPTASSATVIANGAAVLIDDTAVSTSLNLDGGSTVITTSPGSTSSVVPLAVSGAITISTGGLTNGLATTYSASAVTAGLLLVNNNATIVGGRIGISSISVAAAATLNLLGAVFPSATTTVAIGAGATVVARSSSDNAATIFAQASFTGDDGLLAIEGNGVAFTGNSGAVTLNTNVLATSRLYRIDNGDTLSVSSGRTLELRAPGAILDTAAITIDSGATLLVNGSGTVNVARGSYVGAASGSTGITVNGAWVVGKDVNFAFLSTNASQITGTGTGTVYGTVSSSGTLTLNNVNFESGSGVNMGANSVLSLAGGVTTFTDASITTGSGSSISANNAAGLTLTRCTLTGATFSGGLSTATISVADSMTTSGASASTISSAGPWAVAADAVVTANAPTTITVSDFSMGRNASLVANNAVYVKSAATTAASVSVRGRISSSMTVADAGYYLGGAVGAPVGAINFRSVGVTATESSIEGAKFYLEHTGAVDVQLTNTARVTADSWFVGRERVNGQNQGNVYVTGSLIASSGATAYLSTIVSVYTTGVLAAHGGNVNVNGTTSIQGGLVSATGSNHILVSAGVNGGTNYLEFQVPGAVADRGLSSRVEGVIRVEAVGLVAVRANANATTTNSTWFMPPVGNAVGGLIDIAEMGSLVHQGATGNNVLSFTGVTLNVQGSLVAPNGPVTFGTFTGADGTTKAGTTVTVGSNGVISAPFGITVGSAADTTTSALTFAGSSLTSASTLSGNVTVNSGSTASATGLQVTGTSWFLGGGATQINGWLRAAAPVALATTTSTWAGVTSLESGSGGMLLISGATSCTGVNVTTTSATSNSANVDVKSGGSLTFTAGTSRWDQTTAGVATGSVFKVNSGATLVLEESTIGTDANKADIVVDGTLRAAAGTAATVKSNMALTGSLIVERVATFSGAALTMSGAASEIVINAHPTRGFGSGGATFTGACTIAGKLVVNLNGYRPSTNTKILVATFGPDATPVSGSFSSSTATLEFVDPVGRRLLATAGQVTLTGNKAYYDPSTASNAAAPAVSSVASVIVASLAAVVAIVAAL